MPTLRESAISPGTLNVVSVCAFAGSLTSTAESSALAFASGAGGMVPSPSSTTGTGLPSAPLPPFDIVRRTSPRRYISNGSPESAVLPMSVSVAGFDASTIASEPDFEIA